MSNTIDDLVTAVAAQTGEVASLTAFIAGLEQQLRDALANVTLSPETQAKVDAVFAGVTANSQAISDAIASNPGAPTPPAPAPAA